MSAVLAQLNLFEGASVPPLPSSPLIERILLDNPWPTVVAMLLVGVVGFLILNQRGRAKHGLVVFGAALVAAAGAFVCAMVVETDREAMKRRSRELIGAVARVEVESLEELLDGDMELNVTQVGRGVGKEQTIASVRRYLGSVYPVREHTILELQSTLDGPRLGRTQVRVRVTSDVGVLPSWWRVDWLRDTDGTWRARRIEALWIPGVSRPGG